MLQRDHSKLYPMLAALIMLPSLAYSYNIVYMDDLNVYFRNNYDNYYYYNYYPRNTFLSYNGICVYGFSTFFAVYFAFCIINGILMLAKWQKDANFEKIVGKIVEKMKFETFFGFLSLETGAIVIATTSVILGVACTPTLFLMNRYNYYSYSLCKLFNIVYEISLVRIDFIFLQYTIHQHLLLECFMLHW